MNKDIIAPLQAYLLSKKRCPGCGRPLDRNKCCSLGKNQEKIICTCNRIFIWDKEKKRCRWALFEKV